MFEPQVRVQVWFGKHAIADHCETDVVLAARYASAMHRRFPSLRVTSNQPLPSLTGVEWLVQEPTR